MVRQVIGSVEYFLHLEYPLAVYDHIFSCWAKRKPIELLLVELSEEDKEELGGVMVETPERVSPKPSPFPWVSASHPPSTDYCVTTSDDSSEGPHGQSVPLTNDGRVVDGRRNSISWT